MTALMKHTIAAATILSGAMAFTTTPAAAQGEEPKIQIGKIFAFGKGCKSDVNGKPLDWGYTVNHKLSKIDIEFENFLVTPETKDGWSDCQIRMNITYPAGKTLFVYNSQVIGEAAIDAGEEGEIRTELTIPSYRNPAKYKYSIKEGTDGRFETAKRKYAGRQDAPCGAADYPITFHIYASLFGPKDKQGFVQVTSNENAFTNIYYILKDCE